MYTLLYIQGVFFFSKTEHFREILNLAKKYVLKFVFAIFKNENFAIKKNGSEKNISYYFFLMNYTRSLSCDPSNIYIRNLFDNKIFAYKSK